MEIRKPKPQAASHMVWFFLVPCFAFVLWAGFKMSQSLLTPKKVVGIEERLDSLMSANSPGDRWQAAANLSQDLQQLIKSGALSTLPIEVQNSLFTKLAEILDLHKSDVRLKRYLLLILGQSGDARALSPLVAGLSDPDNDLRFFSAWGLVDLLGKNPSLSTSEIHSQIATLLTDSDSALRKVATTFLVQVPGNPYRVQLMELLKDQNVEVRWNTAVALASVGDTIAEATLLEVFDLASLRALDIGNRKDLISLLSPAAQSAKRLNSERINSAIEKLKSEINPRTPEGRAITEALSIY